VIDGEATERVVARPEPAVDVPPAPVDPRVVRWHRADKIAHRVPWPVRDPGADELIDRRPWNAAALLAPWAALLCAPVGLCLGLLAAGLVPVLVCVGGLLA